MKVPPIEAVVHIQAPIERVWKVFVNENGWDGWFTDGMRMELKPGGKIRFRWIRKTFGEEVTDNGVIVSLKENQIFEFLWNEFEDGYRSHVTMNFFESSMSGTWVRVTDEVMVLTPKDMEILLQCAVGWGEMLTLAKLWIEKGIFLLSDMGCCE